MGLKAKARVMQLKGEAVPAHMELPNCQDILKMRQLPTMNSRVEAPTMDSGVEAGQNEAKSFVFVAKYLIGAVLGIKEWDNYKFHHQLTKKVTESDETFLYVVLVNLYNLWKNTNWTRVGTGNLTKEELLWKDKRRH
jgi:hypothetical protein